MTERIHPSLEAAAQTNIAEDRRLRREAAAVLAGHLLGCAIDPTSPDHSFKDHARTPTGGQYLTLGAAWLERKGLMTLDSYVPVSPEGAALENYASFMTEVPDDSLHWKLDIPANT